MELPRASYFLCRAGSGYTGTPGLGFGAVHIKQKASTVEGQGNPPRHFHKKGQERELMTRIGHRKLGLL